MNDTLDYASEVRKNLINMLMFSLYSDERTIFREYVQNALDSVNKAVRLHVLDQAKDGVVNIDIDSKQRSIVIRDNGTGIQAADAVRVLLDISSTTKDGIVEAGQFGIGRLVGGGYCHELIFITSARGEGIATKITFDVDKIWKMVKEDPEDYLATYVIDQCTKREHIPTSEHEHFFEVQLNQVKKEYASTLLNSSEVISYLNMIAPVEYKPQFNNVLIYGSTKDKGTFCKLHEGLEKVQLFVGNTRIQKQYGLLVEGNKDKIDSLVYFKISDPDYGDLGWGWYALTKFTVQIPKDDALVGFRLRIHNILIGDANLLSGKPLWPEDRGNSYFYGEIFATHPNIRPDGARDGLAPTSESKAFYAALASYFKELKQLYTKANEAKKAIDHIRTGIEYLKKRGFGDYKWRDEIDNKGVAKFEQLEKRIEFEPAKRMLELYRPEYLEEKEKAYALIRQKEQPSTPSKTVAVPKEKESSSSQNTPSASRSDNSVTSASPYADIEPTSSTNRIGDKPVKPFSNPPIENEPQLPFVSPPAPVQKDIIASLNGILDKSEVWIIRRVFKVLNENCPNNDHDKRLIEQLEHLIVKEFSNGN